MSDLNTRFRPEEMTTATGSGKWLGYQNVGIVDWASKSDLYDWADVYLIAKLKLEDSQYLQDLKFVGSFDKEPNGNIKACTLLKRLYWLFDEIGFQGGPNVRGEMVDENGKSIDLVNHLNINYVTDPLKPSMDYIVYIYKELSKKDGKAYTTVFPKIAPNTPAGRKDLEGYINFMKSKNLIKEVEDGGNSATSNGFISESPNSDDPF